MTKKQISKLISQGNIEQALDILLSYTEYKEKSIIILSGQYQLWKKNNLLGITDERYTLNRVSKGVLDLLDYFELEEEFNTKIYLTSFQKMRLNNLSMQILEDYDLFSLLNKKLSITSDVKEVKRIEMDIDDLKQLIKKREKEYFITVTNE
jgi:hypothetical protein